jgi:hypothetical protein
MDWSHTEVSLFSELYFLKIKHRITSLKEDLRKHRRNEEKKRHKKYEGVMALQLDTEIWKNAVNIFHD